MDHVRTASYGWEASITFLRGLSGPTLSFIATLGSDDYKANAWRMQCLKFCLSFRIIRPYLLLWNPLVCSPLSEDKKFLLQVVLYRRRLVLSSDGWLQVNKISQFLRIRIGFLPLLVCQLFLGEGSRLRSLVFFEMTYLFLGARV